MREMCLEMRDETLEHISFLGLLEWISSEYPTNNQDLLIFY